MVSVTDSLLSFFGEPETESWVPSSIVSWRIFLAVLFESGPPFFRCFRFPRPFLPNTLSLHVYHFLIIFLAVAVFDVEQFVIVLWLAPFSRLRSYVLYWFLTSDSQSSYSGRDSLLYSSVGDFWVVYPARSGAYSRGVSVKHTSLSFTFDLGVTVGLLIRVHLRRSTLIPASSSKREVG